MLRPKVLMRQGQANLIKLINGGKLRFKISKIALERSRRRQISGLRDLKLKIKICNKKQNIITTLSSLGVLQIQFQLQTRIGKKNLIMTDSKRQKI